MTRAVHTPGSLLAERFRVASARQGDGSTVIDARDELSAGARRVRLLVVQSASTAAEIETAVRRLQRYAVGVSGHAELVGAFALEPGSVGLAYVVGEARLLDELLATGSAVDGAALAAGVERALGPLHAQGMAHGSLSPEVVGQDSDGSVIVLGFGLCQALGRAASPSGDAEATEGLRRSLLAPATVQQALPELPEPPREPEPAPEAAPEPAPTARAPEQLSAPPPPPIAPVPQRTRSSRAPSGSRSWLGPLALALGGVAMVAGVTIAFVLSRDLVPAPSPSATALAVPPPLTATVSPLPLPPPSPSSAPVPSAAPAPDGAREIAPLSPPMRSELPVSHLDAPLPVDRQPAWGPADAPVTLTLFADLECAHTRALLPGLLRIKTELGNDLRWVFRHRPLSQHSDGEEAARLLAGVGEQLGPGVFWKLISELAADPEAEASQVIERWLDQSGVDAARRTELEASPSARELVDADVELAARLFVRATPTLFINGQRTEGYQPQAALAAAVLRERRAGLFAMLAGTPADAVYVQRTTGNLLNQGEDPPERACIAETGAPLRGSGKAPVSIVHFCAYESSYCQKAEPALAALLARHPNDVRILWRSFPIVPEGDGRTAANFALAARRAGGDKAFWLVHRALLEARAAVDAPALAKVVKELGMDGDGLLSSARSREHDASVKADMELGRKLSVTGVPTNFVNGRRKDGLLTVAELEAMVAEELALARRLKEAGRGPINELICSARSGR